MDVAVDRWDLVYHAPETLDSTIDMDLIPKEEAEGRGARPCTSCFHAGMPGAQRIGEVVLVD